MALTEAIRLAMELPAVCRKREGQPDIPRYVPTLQSGAGLSLARYIRTALDTLRRPDSRCANGGGCRIRCSPCTVGWQRCVAGLISRVARRLRVALDASREREKAFGRRVLDFQKVPSVALLLHIDETLRSIAAADTPAVDTIGGLEKDLAALPTVEIPQSMKLEGHPEDTV